MKTCSKCKQTLPIEMFAKNRARYDGLQNYCRTCDKAKSSSYAENNRAKALQRTLRWQAKDRANYLTKRRQNYAKNKEAGRLKTYPLNLDLHRMTQMRRRAQLQDNGIYLLLPKEMKKLLAGPCFYCQSQEQITIDHIIPICKGGRHAIGNLVSACKSCNSSKGQNLLIVWLQSKPTKGKHGKGFNQGR